MSRIRKDFLANYNHDLDGLKKIWEDHKFEQKHLDWALRHYCNYRKYEQFMFILEKGGDPNYGATGQDETILRDILANPSIYLGFAVKILPDCLKKGMDIHDIPSRFKIKLHFNRHQSAIGKQCLI